MSMQIMQCDSCSVDLEEGRAGRCDDCLPDATARVMIAAVDNPKRRALSMGNATDDDLESLLVFANMVAGLEMDDDCAMQTLNDLIWESRALMGANPEGALIEELQDYCREQGLPHMSADELQSEEITDAQRAYLKDYCERWDAAVKA